MNIDQRVGLLECLVGSWHYCCHEGHIVFEGLVQSGFLTPKWGNWQPKLVQTDPRCWAITSGPFRAGLLQLMDQKKAGSDWSFVVKFVVPI